ncbi:unnamed protein product [Gordionus sp. m RMFG-2023]
MYLYLNHVDDYLTNVKRGLVTILPAEFRSAPYEYWDTPLSVTIDKVEIRPFDGMCMNDYHNIAYVLALGGAFCAVIGLPVIFLWYLKRKRLLQARNPWNQSYFNRHMIIPYTAQELKVSLTYLDIIDEDDIRSGLITEEEQDISKVYDIFLKVYLKYYYELYYDFDYKYDYDIKFDYWTRYSKVNKYAWPRSDYSAEVFEKFIGPSHKGTKVKSLKGPQKYMDSIDTDLS